MEKDKKVKLFIGIFYIILISMFLYFIFSNVSITEITNYDFIKNNNQYFKKIKQANTFIVTILFVLFTIVWIVAAGFVLPIALLSGFLFGKWLGLILLLIGITIGSTVLYTFANYFFKDFVKKKFHNRFYKIIQKFQKSEFLYMLLYRLIGGIPFVISNILPCLFNVKVRNFFWATAIGLTPQFFLIVSLGSGLEKVIEENSSLPSIYEIISSPDIYIPLFGFIIFIIATLIFKKIFYK